MARFYADENVPLPVAEALQALGHDVLTMQEAGVAGQAMPDREVLAFAESQRLILITLNRKHFIRLHREHPEHCGIVICTFDPDFAGLAQRISDLLALEEPTDGKLLRVYRPG